MPQIAVFFERGERPDGPPAARRASRRQLTLALKQAWGGAGIACLLAGLRWHRRACWVPLTSVLGGALVRQATPGQMVTNIPWPLMLGLLRGSDLCHALIQGQLESFALPAVTSSNSVKPGHLAVTAADGGRATLDYEVRKCQHQNTLQTCSSEGLQFLPLVVEGCAGGWGPTATKTWHQLSDAPAAEVANAGFGHCSPAGECRFASSGNGIIARWLLLDHLV